MKSRKFGIGLLLLLAVVVSSGTFAYWASSVTGNNDIAAATVTIGSGNAVTTTVTVADLSDASALIPTAHGTGGVDDTASLSLTVNWDAVETGADGTTGTLAVTLNSYTLGTLTEGEIDAMFTISLPSNTTITEGTPLSSVITIVFGTEPASKVIYDEVAAGTLALNLTYTVTTP